ncbi:MAG: hypothetical protein K8823_555 [Cenarchaeum symbiont of Oopsacas minuta]|nr:hypothetical protein [Cenarchaeum symbiont of Oopsacas minuta]
MQSSTDLRKTAESKWNKFLRGRGIFSSNSLEGSSPPSVFVGSFGYPRLSIGPMAVSGNSDSSFLDAPEKWAGMKLDDIVRYRMNLVRGIKHLRAQESSGRYIESLQDMVMCSHSADVQMIFEKPPIASSVLDGQSAPFGPIGNLKSAKFSSGSSEKKIERVYYDRDLLAGEAVLDLYTAGVEISKIQKCFSIGMMGKKRRLVPTKWSITATDDIISKWLVNQILDEPQIDSYETYYFEHLGNIFSIVLFPHRWMYEMVEAWYSNGVLGFGSDHEDARGIGHVPAIAGAYHAAKLAVAEYLYSRKVQAGVLVLREIGSEYSIPVGVWQVREAVRSALAYKSVISEDLHNALDNACSHMHISKNEWLKQGHFIRMMLQKTLSEYMH